MCRSELLASKLLASGFFPLKHVFQRELHDPRIQSGSDLAEGVAVQSHCRIASPEAVRDIECLRANLDSLRFRHLKSSRQSCIELPGRRTAYGSNPNVAQTARRRISERCRIQEPHPALVKIWVSQYLIRTLGGDAAQSDIRSRRNRQSRARRNPHQRSKPPSRGHKTQGLVRESRTRSDGGEIEKLPSILS